MAYYYFPSCKVSATYPKSSRMLSEYIYHKFNIEPVGCCRINFNQLTSDDIAIVTCNNCAAIIQENTPAAIKFAWEIINEDPTFPLKDYSCERMTIQDCWISKENIHQQTAIRSLLKKMNIEIEELDNNHENSIYCGKHLLSKCNQSNLSLAHKKYENHKQIFKSLSETDQINYLKKYCETIPTEKVICSCRSCAEGITIGGSKGIHIIELLFSE